MWDPSKGARALHRLAGELQGLLQERDALARLCSLQSTLCHFISIILCSPSPRAHMDSDPQSDVQILSVIQLRCPCRVIRCLCPCSSVIASCHRSRKPRQTHLIALIYRAEGGHCFPLGLALLPWDGAGCGSAQFLTLFLILSAPPPLPAPFLQDVPVVSTHCTAVDTSSAF